MFCFDLHRKAVVFVFGHGGKMSMETGHHFYFLFLFHFLFLFLYSWIFFELFSIFFFFFKFPWIMYILGYFG